MTRAARPLRARLLTEEGAPGRWNMAVDEALATAGDPAFALTLRFYEWKPPAISLGHHQSVDALDLDEVRARGLDVVRRPTGGMAVLHDDEITVALAGPDIRLLEGGLGETVALLARATAVALASAGVIARAEPGSPIPSRSDRVAGAACFSGGGRHEVWIAGRKIAGFAARRWGRAFLVHGSFLLGPSHLALSEVLRIGGPEREALRAILRARTVCVADLDPRGREKRSELIRAIAAHVAESATVTLEPGSLGPFEQARAREIATSLGDNGLTAPEGVGIVPNGMHSPGLGGPRPERGGEEDPS